MCRDGAMTSGCSVEKRFHGRCHLNSIGSESLTLRCPWKRSIIGAPMVASYSGAVGKGQPFGSATSHYKADILMKRSQCWHY